MGVVNVLNYRGEANVPQDVRRRRLQVMQNLQRMGTPVLLKHMYNVQDVDNGDAVEASTMSSIYKQTRRNDPVSHGVGYVSVELATDEWINPSTGAIVKSSTSPGAGYTLAPKYRGYGPGYLTYVIFPDVAEDMFRLNEAGALIRIQTARAIMGWYPEANDNDLLILVELDREGNIVATNERYELKQTNPVSLRGLNRRGKRFPTESADFGNQYTVNQTFELTLLPHNHELYKVETDR